MPHASGRADDEDVLAGLEPALVTQRLERGDGGDWDGGRLLEREVGRLGHNLVLSGEGIFGEGAGGNAEHLITRLQLGHALTDRLDAPRDIAARDADLGRAEPVAHRAHQVRLAGHEVPHARVEAGGDDPYEHFAITDDRLVDVLELQDIRRTVGLLDDCLHGAKISLLRHERCP